MPLQWCPAALTSKIGTCIRMLVQAGKPHLASSRRPVNAFAPLASALSSGASMAYACSKAAAFRGRSIALRAAAWQAPCAWGAHQARLTCQSISMWAAITPAWTSKDKS